MDKNKLNFSFAGSSWLMSYGLGVAKVLQKELTNEKLLYSGASSGSITATALAVGWDPEEIKEILLELSDKAINREKYSFLGAIGRMTGFLTYGLEHFWQKGSVYSKARQNLYIPVTRLYDKKALIIKDFYSDEDLKKTIFASCYIPIYYEKPVKFRNYYCIDGGITNNTLLLNQNTVVVSPYKEEKPFQISPDKRPSKKLFIFPNRRDLAMIYQRGNMDAYAFLKEHNKFIENCL